MPPVSKLNGTHKEDGAASSPLGRESLNIHKWEQHVALVRRVQLFGTLGDSETEAAAKALEPRDFKAGEVIIKQGEQGYDCFFVEAGECYATINIGRDVDEWMEVKSYGPGGFFGERALLRSEPRAASITCRTDVKALRLTAEAFLRIMRHRDHKENLLRGVFETMSDEQIAKLAGALQRRTYSDKESIITQGELEGQHFFILDVGECVATIKNFGQDQEVMRYHPGTFFPLPQFARLVSELCAMTQARFLARKRCSRMHLEAQQSRRSETCVSGRLAAPISKPNSAH